MRRTLTLLLAAVVLSAACPAFAGPPYGEFSRDSHAPVLWSLHASMNSRDFFETDKFRFLDSLGAGFSLYFLINPSSSYTPHKLLYFYVDNDFSSMFKKELVYTLAPGFMVRTYIPFFKLSYGAGCHFKFGYTRYSPWGFYGQAMIDFHRFYLGSRLIIHPGSDRIENEIQFGYLFPGRRR